MDKETIIALLKKRTIRQFLLEHQMKHIWLSGSFSRDLQGNNSDIDIVYEYDDTIEMKDRWIVTAKVYLEKQFGRSVDILDKDYIHPLIKTSILSDMKAVW